MNDHHSRPAAASRDTAANREPAAPSVPDERDAKIERLERTLAEQRQKSAALRETVEELSFKLNVLEKSYEKQLADARLRADVAERELAERQAELAALGDGQVDAVRLLTDVRDELKRVTAERDRLRKHSAATGSRPIGIGPAQGFEPPAEDSLGDTVNRLLAGPGLPRTQPAEREDSPRVRARDDEVPLAEMLPAELVFPADDEDDD